uniref:Protein maelstrom homolog n=1 Tax=Cacopsylla melanoneura TaxID=428564 RepID=A0A8D8ZKW7_9HEMI
MTKRRTKFKKMEGEEKYTSTEIPVSQLVSRANEAHSKDTKQNVIIEKSISYLHELNNLETESFYCIHVNWLCVTVQEDRFDELNKVKVFYPGELAIVEFNLKQGMLRRFNKFINIPLPKGYAAEAKDRRERVHRIPQDNELGESDLNVVYTEMKNFLTKGQPNGSIPPLYTREDNVMANTSIEAVRSVLKTLYCHAYSGASFSEAALAGDEWQLEFKVYPLNKLLFELGKLYNPSAMVDISVADCILEKEPYMYHDGIACQLHVEVDCTQNCSLSHASRWPMVMREFCLPDTIKTEKLITPPVELIDCSKSAPKETKQSQLSPGGAQAQVQNTSTEHNKLYPAMKPKEAGSTGQVTFVHNPASNASPAPATSNVSVGSAWAKPLVYQPPAGAGYSSISSAGSSQAGGATDNFPPLGGLRISSQPPATEQQQGSKKNQPGRKKK